MPNKILNIYDQNNLDKTKQNKFIPKEYGKWKCEDEKRIKIGSVDAIDVIRKKDILKTYE